MKDKYIIIYSAGQIHQMENNLEPLLLTLFDCGVIRKILHIDCTTKEQSIVQWDGTKWVPVTLIK